MTRDTKHLHMHPRLLIGIVCSLLIIGSSVILLVLRNAPGQTSSPPASRTAATTRNTHATATTTPTPTTPTSTATQEGITPTPTPLFADNFSNTSQGWYINNKDGYIRSLTPNGLQLTDINHHPLIESLPTNHKFGNFTLTATLTLMQGDTNDSMGLYLRGDSNLDHDYRIDIFGNNTYAVSKEYLDADNMPQTLYIIAPTHVSQLKPRGTANTLTVIMAGVTMFLFINGKFTNAIIDEDYTSGQISLFVTNGATSSGVTAVFSSIAINPAPSNQYPLIGGCPTPTPTPSPTGTTTPTPSSSGTTLPGPCK